MSPSHRATAGDERATLRLEHLADAVPTGPLVPTHRSFRPAQVLIDGGDIAFIDFDGLCTAEPAIDVALFRAALRDATLRHAPDDPASRRVREQAVSSACDEFLAAYEGMTLALASHLRELGAYREAR